MFTIQIADPPAAPTATLAAPTALTGANLATATVTVTLANTMYVDASALGTDDFELADTIAGTVSVGGVTRTSNTVATLTLAHSGEAIPDSGTLSVTVLASAHAGTDDLPAVSVPITVTNTVPGFGSETVAAQTYTVGTSIGTVMLPPATGGNGALTYALAPALPSGLTFTAADRTLTGTPAAGTAQPATTYTYTASDSDTNTAPTDAVVLMFTIQIADPPAAPTATLAAPTALTGANLATATVTVTLANTMYVDASALGTDDFELADTIAGTVSVGGVTRTSNTVATLTLAHSGEAIPDSGTLSVTVLASAHVGTGELLAGSVPITVTNTVPDFGSETVDAQTYTVGTSIGTVMLPPATGGNGALTYALAPALPSGLTFTAADRTLTGTPAVGTVQAATAYTYTASDSDTNTAPTDADVLMFTIQIADPPAAPTATLAAPTALTGANLATATVTVTLDNTMYVDASALGTDDFELADTIAGTVSVGGVTRTSNTVATLTLAHSGEAIPDSGTLSVTVLASAHAGTDDLPAVSVPITVTNTVPGFGSETVDAQTYTVGTSIGTVMLPPATGGNGASAYALAPALPSGLTFTAADRTLTGTPAAGTAQPATTYTYTASDSDTNTAPTDAVVLMFTIQIVAPPAAPTATLAAPTALTGANLATATVTVTLANTMYVDASALGTDDFELADTIAGTVSVGGVTRTSNTVATLTLAHSGEAIPDSGTLSVTVLASAHAGTDDLPAVSVPITVTNTVPGFGSETVADQTYTVGTSIGTVMLPPATGGNGALTYALAPALPSGLTFTAADRTLTGTPAAGTAQPATTYTYTASDSDTNTAPTDAVVLMFTIQIADPPAAPTAALAAPTALTGANLATATVTVTLANTMYVDASALGTDDFELTDTIAGTVSVGGVTRTSNTVATLTLAHSGEAIPDSGTLSVTVLASAHVGTGELLAGSVPITVTNTVPDFGSETVADQTYTVGTNIGTVTLPPATGGNGALTYALAPALPSGLTFTAADRTLTGTPAAGTAQPATTYTYTASDSDTNTAPTDADVLMFTIQIVAPPAAPTATLAAPTALTGANLATATVTVTLANTMYVDASALGTDDFELADTIAGTVSVGGVTRTSNTVATLTLAHSGEAIPDSGTLSVTVLASAHAGTDDLPAVSVPITVTNTVPGFGSETVAAQTYTVGTSIGTVMLPPATGGNGALTYALAPALPSGLTFTAADRTLTGTPAVGTVQAATAYTYTASDSDTNTAPTDADVLMFTIQIADPPAAPTATLAAPTALTGANLATATVTVTLDNTMYVDASALGTDDFELADTIAGTVSVGGVTRTSNTVATLTLAHSGEAIPDSGTLSVTVLASAHAGTDDLPAVSVPITVTNTVPDFGSETVAAQTYTVGTSIGTVMLPPATGGNGALTYALAPALPSGLTFTAADRTLTGTPAARTAQPATTYTYTASDSDTNTAPTDADVLMFTIQIADPPAAPTATLAAPTALTGANLATATVTVTLDNTMYVDASALGTDDFELADTIAGTVTVGGVTRTSNTVATLTLAHSGEAIPDSGTLSVTVLASAHVGTGELLAGSVPITVTNTVPDFGSETVAAQTYTVGTNIGTVILPPATGGNGASAYALAPALPSGLTFTAADRTLTGTPAVGTVQAATAYTYTASDSDTNTAPTDADVLMFTIQIADPPAAPTATLAAPTALTGANLATATVTVTLDNTMYVDASALGTDDFELADTIAGTVSVGGVTRTSNTVATLTLAHSGEAIPDSGTLSVTVLASAHAGTDDLPAVSVPITVTNTVPDFGSETVAAQTYTVGTSIGTVMLPPATGGNGALTYALAPALPSGLTFTAADRTLTGTPGTAQVATTYTYTASDSDTDTATTDADVLMFTIQIVAPPAAPTATLAAPTALTGANLATATVTVTLANTMYVDAAALGPDDFSLTDDIAGTVSVGGVTRTSNTVATLTLAHSGEAIPDSGTLSVTVLASAHVGTGELLAGSVPITVTNTVPDFGSETVAAQTYTVGTNIGTVILPPATGGNGASAYALAPALPSGLTFTAADRTLTGTPAVGTVQAATAYTYTASDSDTNTAPTDADVLMFTIQIADPATPTAVLTGPLTEANLFAATATAPIVTVTLVNTAYEAAPGTLMQSHFTVTDNVAGSVRVSDVTRISNVVARLTLAHSGEDITADGTLTVALDAAGHTGTGDLTTNTIPITASTGTNVCGRTAQVRDEIVTRSAATECTSITDLAMITTLDFSNPAPGDAIDTLQSGDFAGLAGLRFLRFNRNSLTTLPVDIFAGLSALEELNLFNNDLNTLDVGVFAGLTSVVSLYINRNAFTSLPVGIFDELAALDNLGLHDNPFTPGTGLPAGIFDDVLDTLDPVTTGGDFGLAVDNTGRAAHFVCSRDDSDDIVVATGGDLTVDGACLRVESAQFDDYLTSTGATLNGLTLSAGAGTLVPPFATGIMAYSVSVPNRVTSVTVTPTATQSRAAITVNGDSVDSASASDAITLTAGTPMDILIVVTAADASTRMTYTVTATRATATQPAATLTGTVTEANLLAGTATVTVTLENTTYVDVSELGPDDFRLTDTIAGTVSVSAGGVTRSGDTVATLALTHSGEAIPDSGTLLVTVLASAHTGTGGDLPVVSVPITVTNEELTEQLEELTEQLNEQVLPQVFLKLADVGSRLIADRLSAGAIVGGGTISSQAHGGEAGSSGLMAQLGQWLSGDAAEVELSRRLQNLDDFELRDFIDDLSFAADGKQVGMAGGSLYGIGNYTRLSGDEDGVDWDGDLYSGYVGLDTRLRNGALAGVLLSYSKGEFEYANTVGGKGEYDLDISSVNPYIGWSLSEDLDIWASVGYGIGEVELNDNGGSRSSDLSVGSVSVGASGRLVVSDELIAGGRSELHLRGDGSASQVDFDRSDAGFTDVSSHRLRLIVEASHLRSGASGSVRSGLELGVRHDGGDGQDGQGLELGGSLEWSNTRGLTLSGRTRVLTLADYDEWGVSGILRLAPGQGGRGLSFSLSPGYGQDDSSTEQLWQRGASAVSSAQTARLRMDGEVGYGLWLLGGTVQPYVGASLLQGGGSTQRMGARLELGRGVQLGLEGSRHERTSADAEHRIELQWQWSW